MLKSTALDRKLYHNEQDFKKDFESALWCYFDNALWSKIKPKKALPWYGADMQVALSRILKY